MFFFCKLLFEIWLFDAELCIFLFFFLKLLCQLSNFVFHFLNLFFLTSNFGFRLIKTCSWRWFLCFIADIQNLNLRFESFSIWISTIGLLHILDDGIVDRLNVLAILSYLVKSIWTIINQVVIKSIFVILVLCWSLSEWLISFGLERISSVVNFAFNVWYSVWVWKFAADFHDVLFDEAEFPLGTTRRFAITWSIYWLREHLLLRSFLLVWWDMWLLQVWVIQNLNLDFWHDKWFLWVVLGCKFDLDKRLSIAKCSWLLLSTIFFATKPGCIFYELFFWWILRVAFIFLATHLMRWNLSWRFDLWVGWHDWSFEGVLRFDVFNERCSWQLWYFFINLWFSVITVVLTGWDVHLKVNQLINNVFLQLLEWIIQFGFFIILFFWLRRCLMVISFLNSFETNLNTPGLLIF